MTVLLAMTAPARLSVPEITAALENPAKPKKRAKAETVPLPHVKAKPKPQQPPVPMVDTSIKKVPRKVAPQPPEPVVEEMAEVDEDLMPLAVMEAEPVPPVEQGLPMRTSRRFEARQEEMSFDAPPRGRFEKTHETMYRGENLDQPTFRRRGLKIRV